MQSLLGQHLHSYRQQNFILQDLDNLRKKKLITSNHYLRYKQALKSSIYKHKDSLINLLSAEIEGHITRLEEMAAHAEFSTGVMYEKIGGLHALHSSI